MFRLNLVTLSMNVERTLLDKQAGKDTLEKVVCETEVLVIQIENAVCEFIHLITGWCQVDLVMRPVKQPGIKIFFQLPHLKSHGWLRHVQGLGGLGKAQQLRHSMKDF